MIAASNLLRLLKQSDLITLGARDEPTVFDSPWYIKVLMAFCGWLAAIFILGFFGLSIAGLFDNSYALSILGIVMIGCSLGVLYSKSSEFFEHLCLAFSFAGQALIVFALFNQGESKDITNWVMLSLMCCSLAIVMPSYIHSLVSACLGTLCFSYLMFLVGLPSFFSGVFLFLVASIWLYEFTLSYQVKKLQAIGYGIVIGLMQFKTSILFSQGGQTWAQEMVPYVNQWLDEGLNTLVLIYIVVQMLRHKALLIERANRLIGIAVVLLFCMGSLYANGIIVGLTFVLLGFANQNKILLVLGGICTLINLSSYYYFLDITLLNKSLIFVGMGSLSLLLMYLNKRLPVGKAL
ncbi:DUF4401 domain-containing protein [Paraglaciecola marina]|uniref:DUF4401 domain-containing protein n=1 Tax=Paraglaciecola marina TaxID=2500157 RepID=UPI00105BA585|nr:DUF4401 domain-containing protein [Paraglaciecola marina]